MIPSGRSRFLVATVLAGLVLAGTVVGVLIATRGDDSAPAAAPAEQARARLDLNNALLTTSDLPTGWNAVDPGRHVEDTTVLCGEEFVPPEEPMAEAKAAFRQATAGAMFSERLTAYAGEGADEVMEDFAAALDGCSEWSEQQEGQAPQKYTFKPLEFPEIADDTIALEISVTIPAEEPVTVDSHFVMIRRDDVVILIGAGGTEAGAADVEETERIARMADAKLRRST